MTRKTIVVAAVALFALAAARSEDLWKEAREALASLDAQSMLAHIRILASDEFEGRSPASPGEAKTVGYLLHAFKVLGLKPGNPDGSYVQDVPMVGFTSHPTLTFATPKGTMSLTAPEEYVAVSRHFEAESDVDNSDVVFVGYGIVAPEYGWDDYKGVDVRGKTLLMLVNNPQSFKGTTMTYYGRWTYKYEIAAEKGAAAAIIIHETGPAGYPYEVVMNSNSHENFDVMHADKNAHRANAESWIRLDKAKELLAASGLDLDQLKAAALSKDFRPVPLNTKVTIHIHNVLREVKSKNVVAKLEGDDRKNEYVIYTAHWDHLGRDTTLKGDQIYNGAVDNASGIAMMLELAKAFTKLKEPPDRSILFLAVTAEEKGLMGSKYYGEHPLYPLNKTLADINIDDALARWGRTKDIVVVGYGNSTLDDVLIETARHERRTVGPDPEPEKGFFFRSDQFELAKQGVPALYIKPGIDIIGKPAGFGMQKRAEYIANDYHKPSDDIKSDWDLAGVVDDLKQLFMVGYSVAETKAWPEWKPGTEFKAKREASLR